MISLLLRLWRRPEVHGLVHTWRGRFILAFLAVQLALPLRYYLAHRDPHDERFAWRMFSPMRMAQCTPQVQLDGKPYDLGLDFHEAWVTIAERGRFSVIEEMGKELCHRHPGSEVRMSIDCTYIDRAPQTYGGYDICSVHQL